MANAGSGTTGSQFFLVVSDAGAQNLGTSGSDRTCTRRSAPWTRPASRSRRSINTFGSADGAGTPTKTVTIDGVTVTAA